MIYIYIYIYIYCRCHDLEHESCFISMYIVVDTEVARDLFNTHTEGERESSSEIGHIEEIAKKKASEAARAAVIAAGFKVRPLPK